MKRASCRLAGASLVVSLLTGCATTGGGETTATGAIVGAGSGAVIGAAASRSGEGAVLGALIGGLLGLIVGSEVERDQAARAAVPPAAPRAQAPPGPPPPPPGQWSVVTPPPPVNPPPGPAPDPTRGMLTNSTPWEVHIFIDTPPGGPGAIVLRPGGSLPANLDIGKHRIVAQAFVETQFGRRMVGTFDQILAVDPRAPGWTIRFFEANF